MKKMILAVAVVLCAALSSCSDTERCFTVNVKAELGAIKYDDTYNVWGTRDQINAFQEDKKAVLEKLGIDKNAIKVTATANGKSQEECK